MGQYGRPPLALAGLLVRLAISRTVLEKWVKKSDNRQICANFDPSHQNFIQKLCARRLEFSHVAFYQYNRA